ncbi:hypothetical protein RJT34_00671 [Clitoria ternatea]|uniref:Uncharacterized protein n=1 Tax=Clitoria ternatea TaxID=43366 RepID=A0AAN9KIL9_CLITE
MGSEIEVIEREREGPRVKEREGETERESEIGLKKLREGSDDRRGEGDRSGVVDPRSARRQGGDLSSEVGGVEDDNGMVLVVAIFWFSCKYESDEGIVRDELSIFDIQKIQG